uniref:Apple domain-containing protein n=1 Tax=Parastrongyloides trichosuri TaxID=131310 RepID=A0A0N4ZIU0_PARTI
MESKVTWLLIIFLYILTFNLLLLAEDENDENSEDLFHVDSATIDALLSNVEEDDVIDEIDTTITTKIIEPSSTMATNVINNDYNLSCEEQNLTATFIRHSNLMSKRQPIFSGNIDLLSCINHCKQNIIPFSLNEGRCFGLNYYKNEDDVGICQIVDGFENGDLEKSEEDDNVYHWYEKKCVKVKQECKNKLISFDAIPNHKVKNGKVIKKVEGIIELCFELCNSMNDCDGINYLKKESCELIKFNIPSEKENIVWDPDYIYYKNECIKKNCLLNEETFIIYRNKKIQSPHWITSSKSLQGCMRECISTEMVNCKKIQFLRKSNECYMYDLLVMKTNPSQDMDIYKPVCLNIPLNRICNKQFLYEVIEKTSVKNGINSLYFKIYSTVDRCLQECLDNQDCHIVSFQLSSNKCILYDSSIKNNHFEKSNEVDLYLIGCGIDKINGTAITTLETSTIKVTESFPTPTTTLNNFELPSTVMNDNILIDDTRKIEDTIKKECFLNPLLKLVLKGRILRQEFRNVHQINVMNVTHCSLLCKNSKIGCNIFAYGISKKYCYLSKHLPTDIDKISQENSDFDMWSFSKDDSCINKNIDGKVFGHVIDRTRQKLLNKNDENNLTDNNIELTTSIITTIEKMNLNITTSTPRTTNSLETVNLESISLTTTEKIVTNNSHISLTKKLYKNLEQNDINMIINDNVSKKIVKTTIMPNNLSMIPQIIKENDFHTKIPSNNLKVHVSCHPTGANVTFTVLSKKYTGVVYAAERFSYCKTIVQDSNNFSLFIPRPRFNNSCNSIEIKRQLTAIIVVSNDLVIPYDITTKDDFFYEIKCEYSDKEVEEKVNSGLVVGGPETVMIQSEGSNEENVNISLKIMRGNKAVEHVFIGEQLKAVLISDIKVSGLRVISCNASRIGSFDEKIKSIQLISNGCSMMPQIISDMGVGKYGLEANMTAFRIDGSDHIDILCNVLICHKNCTSSPDCKPIYVRWPRVRLNVPPTSEGTFPFTTCKSACTNEENPVRKGSSQECSSFNHRVGPNQYSSHCQLFQKDKSQSLDGYIEADDRYSFYWKYCVKSNKVCSGDYAFTFLSDRFMAGSEISKYVISNTLEDCLAECLNENDYLCRSVTFNRTSGGCSLSTQNQLSKPAMIKINHNPNFRVDYYENSCFNVSDSFDFDYKCEENGIRVKVNSKLPYTGALYGLYDFFTCKIEPKEEKNFEYLFEYPTVSKNCSDSIRFKGKEMILEVVLSTDGVEPLYFITPDDLTFQARCPIAETVGSENNEDVSISPDSLKNKVSSNPNNLNKLKSSDIVTASPKMSKSLSPQLTLFPKSTTTTDTLESNLIVTHSQLVKHNPQEIIEGSGEEYLFKDSKNISPINDHENNNINNELDSKHSNTLNSLEKLTSVKYTVQKPTRRGLVPIYRTTQGPTFISPPIKSITAHISFPNSNTINLKTGSTYHSSQVTKNEQINKLPETTTTTSKVITTTTVIPITKLSTTSKPSKTTIKIQTTTTTEVIKKFSNIPEALEEEITMTTGFYKSNTEAEKTKAVPSTTINTTIKSTTQEPLTTTSTSTSTKKEMIDIHQTTKTTTEKNIDLDDVLKNSSKKDPVTFEIFHNGQPVEAVVVGSRITLSFTPYYAISPAYMTITGCQVEPIGSLYDWEKEPLAIIKDGCQADHVGLVCPPQNTDYGVRVTVESFRYQTTAQVQYTCLIRICPFAECPTNVCNNVEGCPNSLSQDMLTSMFKSRAKRYLSLEQIRAALAANPYLQQQLNLANDTLPASTERMNAVLQQQLVAIGGDHVVRKRLIVVNSEEELKYYVRTGDVPDNFFGK